MLSSPKSDEEAFSIGAHDFAELVKKLKLPASVVQRLIDLVIYAKMEKPQMNPKVHYAYRIAVKRRLYIRCVKIYPELFKGKKEALMAKKCKKSIAPTVPYLWNSCLPDDEFGLESLKRLKEQNP